MYYFNILFYAVILSSLTFSVDGQKWKLVNSNQSILLDASVPGGVYSEIANKEKVYLFYEYNDVAFRWVGKENWTYFIDFNVSEEYMTFYKKIQIIFHGVDTVSQIYVNDKYVGSTMNMFVRYKFNVKDALKIGTNRLYVNITSPVSEGKRLASLLPYVIPPECWPESYHGECHINKLRKMQASFGWDWGPAFPSVGIWKPVEISYSEQGFTLLDVGTYLTTEGENWRLTVRFWFDADSDLLVNITAQLLLPNENITASHNNVVIEPPTHEARLVLLVPKNKVELWWPNGYGKQKLYGLSVQSTFRGNTTTTSIVEYLSVGFRTVELVEQPVDEDSSKGRSFYFRVNEVPIFAKGSNWIPSDILPENTDIEERVRRLLKAAVDANFNMIRVWGGGIYESNLFYSLCDEYGIMIWQDLMFACNMYPAVDGFLQNVQTEIEQQVKRLQFHPSIVIWGGNNENELALRANWYSTAGDFDKYKKDYVKLYIETIKPIIKSLDPQRPYVSSSPSNGIKTIEEGYIANSPQSDIYGDIHYYDYIGNLWNSKTFHRPRFSSEYGVQSLPAYTTLLNAMNKSDAVWGSNIMQWKQHFPAKYLSLLFQIQLNLPQATTLKDIIYLSQINQAMSIKCESEHYRKLKSVLYPTGEGLTMGALYWQLNDVWEAPSWSSIDYLGNWKMLHYYAKSFFAKVIVSPMLESDDTLYILTVSDLLAPTLQATLFIDVIEWNNFPPISRQEHAITIDPNQSKVVLQGNLTYFLGICPNTTNCFLSFTVLVDNTSDPISIPQNYLFPTVLKKANFPLANVKVEKFKLQTKYEGILTLATDKIALFVWLECVGTREQSVQFSDNGFHMLHPNKKIYVSSKDPLNHDSFLSCLEITNLKPKYN